MLGHPPRSTFFPSATLSGWGLPPLLVRMWEEGRNKPLTLISQKLVIEQIWQLLDFGYPGMRGRFQFPIETLEASTGYPKSDRKSTRLNSSHQIISYAVFCLK